MSFNILPETKNGLGYARWLQNIIRIHRNMFWDHLTLPNIGNSIFDFQISTLGTTIGSRNLPFLSRSLSGDLRDSGFLLLDLGFLLLDLGLWIVNYDWWLWLMIRIHDYDLWSLWSPNTLRLVVAKPPAGSFRTKRNVTFYKTRKLQKLFFFVILRTLNHRFSPKPAPAKNGSN